MCRICEGASPDDVVADAGVRIAVNGYTVFGVGGDGHAPWLYTAGLLDACDHPELIVAGVDADLGARLLGTLADPVLGGDRFEVGDHCGARGRMVRIGAVDPVQYDAHAFAMWHRLREAAVLRAPRLSAVQVVVEDGFCAEHAAMQPLLSDPKARLGTRRPLPNRAARRRQARRPRRR
jgi:hypothetical protein